MAAGISGSVLCWKSGIPRSRLSYIERGYLPVTREEMQRILAALDELIVAKRESEKAALRFGWPAESEISLR